MIIMRLPKIHGSSCGSNIRIAVAVAVGTRGPIGV